MPDAAVPAGVAVLDWDPAFDETTRLLHAEAFADHWGSEPRTADEWAQSYTGHRSFRPDLSLVARDDASGEIVSFVLVSAYPQDWATGPVEAWIHTVGTRRASRDRGVARTLLGEVHRRVAVATDELRADVLGVDEQNPTGALGLYRSLGYGDVRGVTTLRRAPLGADGLI